MESSFGPTAVTKVSGNPAEEGKTHTNSYNVTVDVVQLLDISALVAGC